MPTYDSTNDTLAHIDKVQGRMIEVLKNLKTRAYDHDSSKLASPEKEAFDALGPAEEIAKLEYNGPEYKAKLAQLGPALKHHYENNDHHPEFFKNGIAGMSLMALLEMLADWKAAGERHATGNLRASLDKNKERFHIEPQLFSVLEATAKELGWF